MRILLILFNRQEDQANAYGTVPRQMMWLSLEMYLPEGVIKMLKLYFLTSP